MELIHHYPLQQGADHPGGVVRSCKGQQLRTTVSGSGAAPGSGTDESRAGEPVLFIGKNQLVVRRIEQAEIVLILTGVGPDGQLGLDLPRPARTIVQKFACPPRSPMNKRRLSGSANAQLIMRKQALKLDLPTPLGPIRAVNDPGSKSSNSAMVLNPLMVILSKRFLMGLL